MWTDKVDTYWIIPNYFVSGSMKRGPIKYTIHCRVFTNFHEISKVIKTRSVYNNFHTSIIEVVCYEF